MQCYFHRNSMKKSVKQPFQLFKANVAKSTKELLVQTYSDREKLLKLFQESAQDKMHQTSEELNRTMMSYLSFFRGFVISPLHDLGGVSETVTQIIPSPIRKMYSYSWSDSVAEFNFDINGDAFVELSSVLFNYGLWFMRWSALMPAKITRKLTSQTGNEDSKSGIRKTPGSNTTVLYLKRAAGLFRWVNDNLSQFNIMQDTKVFGTDLDPDVVLAYENQCLGEANEFVFLSLMLDLKTKNTGTKTMVNNSDAILNSTSKKREVESFKDPLLELISLARCIQSQFQKSETALRTILDRRFKKWHTYFLMKMALYNAWEYVLLIKEHYIVDQIIVVDLDYQQFDVRVLWQKYENLCHIIQRLCIKYNNYGKELGKDNPNSWVYRMVDTKKFLNNIITFVNQIRNDYFENKPRQDLKMITRIARVKRYLTLVKPERFQLPKLNDNWTVNVCLDFGIQLFLPNFDPTYINNINIKVNDFMPIWIKRFVLLKRTCEEFENYEKALSEQHLQLKLACFRLLQLRQEFHALITSEKHHNSEDIVKAKRESLEKFNAYLSWLLGLTANDRARKMFGYYWTSSINQGKYHCVKDVEYEICCNVFNMALWFMKSVADLIDTQMVNTQDEQKNSNPESEKKGVGNGSESKAGFKNQDLEFAIVTLREASGMFQFLLDRGRVSKFLAASDQDFSESILKSFRNHCLAEAQEFFFMLSNINWIQMKMTIRIMQLYWTTAEELLSVQIKEQEEFSAKLKWQTYCQLKSYLYKTYGYFYLSEMFPKSGERTVAALQKSQTLLNFFKKQINENREIEDNKWILDDVRFKKFDEFLQQRFQLMCLFFQLNNFDNYAKKYDINLETVDVPRKFDSIIYVTPTKFNLPPVDEYWTENPTIQNILNFDLKSTSGGITLSPKSAPQMPGPAKVRLDKNKQGGRGKKKKTPHLISKKMKSPKKSFEAKFGPDALIKPLFKAPLKKVFESRTKSGSKK